MNFDVLANTIFLTTHGSHAYGTNIETSDVDVKGVCVTPVEYFYGFAYKFEQAEQKDPDQVIYSIQKFCKLAAECNPNIIEVLFTDEKHHRKVTAAGHILLEDRELFLSKKARHTFSGYAHAQLKRIRSHRAWLLDPPKGKPSRADYGLPEHRTVSAQQMGVIKALAEDGYTFTEEAERVLTKEKQYATALTHWKQYEHWKQTRNQQRAALEAKYGFDVKHAMHLVRLMRMCVEILEGKGVQVYRPDREELLAIRRGCWSYDEVVEEAECLDARAEELYTCSHALPHKPHLEKLNNLCIQAINQHHDLLPF